MSPRRHAIIRLAECTWPEAGRLARDRRSVVLLPVGAVEQHGPHLPLAVDWLGAEALAGAVAPHLARAGFRPVLAPALPYGASPLAEGWPGTVSLATGTLARVLREVLISLADQGFRAVVLCNYQADPGQLRALAAVRRALARRRLRVLVAGFSPDPREMAAMTGPRVSALLRSPRPAGEWHSGELETAMMLALHPRLVRRATARALPPAWVDWRAMLRQGKSFRTMRPGGRGYFGAPALARAGTGRQALALRARLIAAELVGALRA